MVYYYMKNDDSYNFSFHVIVLRIVSFDSISSSQKYAAIINLIIGWRDTANNKLEANATVFISIDTTICAILNIAV